jgi:TPP-dependent pyruvate/acetoin dehydrogenase alpha subunit
VSALQQLLAADAALEAALSGGPHPHLQLGRLAPVVAGAVSGVSKADWLALGPRERVGAALRGCAVGRLVDPMAGAQPYKVAPAVADPSARLLQAAGLARATGQPVLCLVGLAAAGALAEALSLAAAQRLPLIVVLSALALPAEAAVAPLIPADPVALAAALGVAGVRITADQNTVQQAVSAARAAGGPALIWVDVP